MSLLPVGISGEEAGYQISRSLRFNSADSAYLNRTFGAGNQKTWTLSAWVKRSALGDNQIFSNYTSGSDVAWIYFNSSNELYFQNYEGSNQLELKTTQVFRDVGAWGHLVVTLDTTQATSSNRAKLYWNGVQITTLTTATYPTQNADLKINTNGEAHEIGKGSSTYFNGYLTEINFIDGSALTPSSFGETDPITGVWTPKKYTGGYGTNGFYLNFSDNSGTTSTTLGKDSSGNGNNWTPNNFSVTAGAGNDSLVDSPTRYGTDTGAGGQVRGNYATLNANDKNASLTLSNGNLNAISDATANWRSGGTTFGNFTSGKWYFEVTAVSIGASSYISAGWENSALTHTNQNAGVGAGNFNSFGVLIATGLRQTKVNGSIFSSDTNANANNDVLMIAVDFDAGKGWVGKNGTWYDSGNPSAGTNPCTTAVSGGLMPVYQAYNAGSLAANFGQRPFAYTAPSGFLSLCTTNLPTPTIADGGEYFNAVLYTGTGSSLGVTGVGFQPDFVWIKERSGAADHGLYDAVRGVQNQLESNTTTAETAEATGLTAFGSDGFTVGALAQLNTNTDTYVAWNWKANGSGVSNTAGSVTSTVSANTTSGISIVTWTAPSGTSTDTIGHGLGVAPKMVIVKCRSSSSVYNSWGVYHASLGNTKYLELNSSGAEGTSTNWWNNTTPTTTVFSVGSQFCEDASNYVAYCFAPVAGYSAFGSYTGNGNANGSFIYTGFQPKFIMWKRSDAVENWGIWTPLANGNGIASSNNFMLFPNLSNAQDTTQIIDVLSNGFKQRDSGSLANANGGTYIYMAFAENPFQYSLAR